MKKSASPSLNLALLLSLLLQAAPVNAAPPPAQQPSAQTPATTQQQPASPQPRPSPPADDAEDDVVRISANLVQVDVVVHDKNNKPVTDLTAADFEILEDDKPQPITSFSYVALSPATNVVTAAARRKAADKSAPPEPPRDLRPEQVRRTIALVVDDLGLSFESMGVVRHSLKKFVDEQMQPNDLVAIIRTRAGMGALQQFTSDKRMLHAAIDKIRWYPLGRGGIGAFAPIEFDPMKDPTLVGSERSGMDDRVRNEANAPSADERDGEEINAFREEIFSVGTLGALNYIVRGLRELPGRKSVLLFSDGFSLANDRGQSTRLFEAVRRLTDLANRASVVMYTLDPRGLVVPGFTAQDDTAGMTGEQMEQALYSRSQKIIDTQSGLDYLARQTGGFSVRNSNDITGGVRRVLDDQRGYYLIGYRPDASTFDAVRGRIRFHNVTARVKRPGLRVRTRRGFYGFTDEQARAMPVAQTRHAQLLRAITSPFVTGGVQLRLTSLFGNAEDTSYVTSLLHINSQNISLSKEPDGWHKAVIDLVALTFGDNGAIVDEVNRTETIRLRGASYERFLRDGLVYVMRVPVKKAGAYQLRVAVRDTSSERVGSASQFIEIPDIKKNRLALSGILIMNTPPPATNGDGASNAGAATNGGNAASPAGASSQGTTPPSSPQQQAQPIITVGEKADVPSASFDATLRRFRRGASVDFFYTIYNARLDKASGRPQLQTSFRLYRDGRQVAASPPKPYDAGNQTDLKRLRAGLRMRLLNSFAPGEYVLQVIVEDMLAQGKRRTATQWINLEIVEPDGQI